MPNSAVSWLLDMGVQLFWVSVPPIASQSCGEGQTKQTKHNDGARTTFIICCYFQDRRHFLGMRAPVSPPPLDRGEERETVPRGLC